VSESPDFSVKRFLISILLIGHLVAVIGSPLSFQAQGPIGMSPSVASVVVPVEPYAQMLYLNRGYAFFAPDPGPSHLFQVAVKRADGTTEEIMFPDLDNQWPRLAYHRHFMLAEYWTEIYHPPGPPRELAKDEPEAARAWKQARDRYEHVRQSFAKHIEAIDPGCEVVGVRRIEHLIPRFEVYRNNRIKLDDPSLYRVMLDQPIVSAPPPSQASSEDSLLAPAGPTETVPVPAGEQESNTSEASEDGT
jgi:hypothetical protein